MGTIVIGKVESGGTKKGDQLLVMPNKVSLVWLTHSLTATMYTPCLCRPTSRWSRSGLTTSRSPRSPRARISRSRSKASMTATCLQVSSSAAPLTPSPLEKCLMPRYLNYSLKYSVNVFHPCPSQIVMLDLKSIVCAGFGCMMHLQAMAEEVMSARNHEHNRN